MEITAISGGLHEDAVALALIDPLASVDLSDVRIDGVVSVAVPDEIGPGDAFEYTSGCPLTTPFGSMEGIYEMQGAGGTSFEAHIARFELREPGAIH